MTTEQWERTKQILEEALRLASDQRPAYLELACGTDHELRAEVESLISSHEAAGSQFLAAAAPEVLELTSSGSSLKAPENQDRKFIGAYRLETKLGEGGMGQVWLAEQTAPVKREVALKLIRGGIFENSALQRFRSERQSLAIMDHPAIAKVFDAGATTDGQPYFVMEYVPGVPITDYCDQKRLKIPERLELFIKVCEGVQHAHQKAIIHRDLKPANILVVEVDGKPLPRIIDFGLAKGCTPDVLGEAQLTLAGGLLGTPGYMSPEQTDPHIQDVDTRTDVYSLGAVLYILLTGSLPFESAEWRKQPLDEALRQLREENPPRPSTKASTQSASTAEARGAEPRQLVNVLRGDLDWITLKALERDRARRYATPSELAADCRRYLHNEPVQAHPPSAWYRGRKFLRRYWAPAAAALLVVASLAVGLYVANRERKIAERRFVQVRQLANQFLVLDTAIEALPGSTQARHQIVSTALTYLEALSSEVHKDRELSLEVATAYLQVARVQGVPWSTETNLGDFEGADKTLAKGEKFVEFVLRDNPKNRRALLTAAGIAQGRMILATGGPREDVVAHARTAGTLMESLLVLGDSNQEEISAATRQFMDMAQAYLNLELPDDAVLYARRAVEISKALAPEVPLQGRALMRLAQALRHKGNLEEALQTMRQGRLALEKARYPSEMQKTVLLAAVWSHEGSLLGDEDSVSLGRPEEAMRALRTAFDMYEQLAGSDPNDSKSRYAELEYGKELARLVTRRNPSQALAIFDRSLARLRETKDTLNRRTNEVIGLSTSVYTLLQLKRLADAKQRIDAAFTVLRETERETPREQLQKQIECALLARAAYQQQTGHPDYAATTYEEVLESVMASKGDPQADLSDAYRVSRIYETGSELYGRIGKQSRAESLKASRRELWRYWDRKLPNNSFVRRMLAAAA